jgi:hypothetical protein
MLLVFRTLIITQLQLCINGCGDINETEFGKSEATTVQFPDDNQWHNQNVLNEVMYHTVAKSHW